ncbi:MAG: S9 family peptidase, partial [Candidatus Sulfotelmatobacter sp.]
MVGPPVAGARALTETFYGIKVLDPYRWLEDSSSAETRKWVAGEMAYTRGVLDAVPGRAGIHARLAELLRIGEIGVPRIAGKYYF